MRGALTLAVAAATAAALPGTAGAATSKYRVVAAKGTEKLAFQGDSSTCAHFGTCDYRGTITYKFGGRPHGRLVLKSGRHGHLGGVAKFHSTGTTTASISAGDTCTDRVRHPRELFSMKTRSRLGKLIFTLHGAKTDYLATDCAGPTEADLERDHALPTGRFKQKDFSGQTTTFSLTGSHSFSENGFAGTARWKLSYKIKRVR